MTTRPQLERFIPLAQAARQSGLTDAILRSLIDASRLTAVVLPNGKLA